MLAGIVHRLALINRNTRWLFKTDKLRVVSGKMEMSVASDSPKLQHNEGSDSKSAEPNKRGIENVEGLEAGVEPKKMKTSSESQAPEGHGNQPYKKKKVAMLLSYCGKGYVGMQRNPGILTIESVLLDALVKAGVVTQDHADNPGEKMKFQRAARTDKGVSAAGQVCSLKINVQNPVEKINLHLPPEICVQSVKRTTQGFDCKQAAAARTYLYMIPTFAFTPVTEHVVETYRITDEILEKINEVLSNFLGTHNFHNFTSGKKPTDQSARRYIMQFSVGKPFMRDGLQFAVIRVKGQSFILHQIRKMIGMTIAIVRGFTNPDVIDKCWGPEKVDVPIAPGLGLVLDRLHYDYYNKKFGNDGSHVPLEWDELKEQIEKFTENYIYRTIIDTEVKEKSMMKWLNTLVLHKLDIIVEGEPRHSALGDANNLLLAKKQLEEENRRGMEEGKEGVLVNEEGGKGETLEDTGSVEKRLEEGNQGGGGVLVNEGGQKGERDMIKDTESMEKSKDKP